ICRPRTSIVGMAPAAAILIARSWIELLGIPPALRPRGGDAIMQAKWPILPEFNPRRRQAKSRPEIRPWHASDAEFGRKTGNRLFEVETTRHWPRLLRCPRTDLAVPGTRGEIGIGFLGRYRLYRPRNPHLAT